MIRISALCALLVVGCSGQNEEAEATPETVSADNAEVSVVDQPAATAEAPATDNQIETVRLYVFDCGRIELSDLSFFASDGSFDDYPPVNAADMCFLVRHPDGDLVWDGGLWDAVSESPDGLPFGPFHITMPVSLKSQFEEIGMTFEDVEYFAPSHSHWDHVGNAALFAGSTLLIDKDERAHMFNDAAREDEQSFALVAPLETSETIEFDGDYDVFGDGAVKIIATPGHTPGHVSLLVILEESGPVLLTGDLYHLLESREQRIVPAFNVDAEQTLASMDKFEALAAETGARVVVQHAMEDFERLPRPPRYLD